MVQGREAEEHGHGGLLPGIVVAHQQLVDYQIRENHGVLQIMKEVADECGGHADTTASSLNVL